MIQCVRLLKTRYLNLTERTASFTVSCSFSGLICDIFLSEEHWHICQPIVDSQHLIPSDLE
jgi:hypothetical protein